MTILFLLFSLQARAYEMVVHIGHTQTRFEVEAGIDNPTLKKVSDRVTKKIALTPKNAAFLDKEFKALLKERSHDRTLCPGNLILLNADPKKAPLAACLGSPLPLTQKLIKVANLLNLTTKIQK